MIVIEITTDIIHRYMSIGTEWLLFSYVYTILFAIVLVKSGKKRGMSVNTSLTIILLFFYLSTIFLSTVVVRPRKSHRMMNLYPFWSWMKMISGSSYRRRQVIENILMLMPIGFLIPFIDRSKHYFIKTICFGFVFSLIIEASQYIFKVGLFEIDDLINNTLGVILSGCLATTCKKLIFWGDKLLNLNYSRV